MNDMPVPEMVGVITILVLALIGLGFVIVCFWAGVKHYALRLEKVRKQEEQDEALLHG